MQIKAGMVLESAGTERLLRGYREILVTEVFSDKLQANVQDLRSGRGWRMGLFSLENPDRWHHTCDAWTVHDDLAG